MELADRFGIGATTAPSSTWSEYAPRRTVSIF
jgi:hypothetical protein